MFLPGFATSVARGCVPTVSAEGRTGPQNLTSLQTGPSFSQNCPSSPVPGVASAAFCCTFLPLPLQQFFGWKGGSGCGPGAGEQRVGQFPGRGSLEPQNLRLLWAWVGNKPHVFARVNSTALSAQGKAQGSLFCLPALHGRRAGHVDSRLRVPHHHHHLCLRRRIRHLPQGRPSCLLDLPAL